MRAPAANGIRGKPTRGDGFSPAGVARAKGRLMSFTASENKVVSQQTRVSRNAAARSRRATWPGSKREVRLATLRLGSEWVLLAMVAGEPDVTRILRWKDGAWSCSCFAARYSVHKTCRHLEP